MPTRAEGNAGSGKTVCVTGAAGYIASWLVKLLLSRGYDVHGTVRHLGEEKTGHLRRLENASENLRLFQADLLDYDAMAAAIVGCQGVFHVATPVPSGILTDPEASKFHDSRTVDMHQFLLFTHTTNVFLSSTTMQLQMLGPVVTGTTNVLKAASAADAERVVVVSSMVAVEINPKDWPQGKIRDESCWSDKEFCRSNESWYPVAKIAAEAAALEYGRATGLRVVTLNPALVFGPLLQPTINTSSQFLIYFLKGFSRQINS
ncbi:hypothetical protein VPH35_083968 [Triticum aestivum]